MLSFYLQFSLNSQMTYDSRMSFTQVYARTGSYKGQVIALKMYEKKHLDINRMFQKEMKLVSLLLFKDNDTSKYFMFISHLK